MGLVRAQYHTDLNVLFSAPRTEKENIAKKIIQEALEKAKNPCVLFSGGKKSMTLLHLVRQEKRRDITVLHIDTGVEFVNIAEFIQKLQKLWGLKIVSTLPTEPDCIIGEERKECCRKLKFAPVKEAIHSHGFDCVFCGLTFSPDSFTEFVLDEFSNTPVIWPIYHFSNEDVMDYVADNNLPLCSLYEQGYQKVNCEPCSSLHEDKGSQYQEEESQIRERMKKLGYL